MRRYSAFCRDLLHKLSVGRFARVFLRLPFRPVLAQYSLSGKWTHETKQCGCPYLQAPCHGRERRRTVAENGLLHFMRIDLANQSEIDSADTYSNYPPQSTSIPQHIMLSAARIASSSSLCFPRKRRFSIRTRFSKRAPTCNSI